MKQYQVPQFITLEDKVIGPLALKQFLYLGGAGGLLFILHAFLIPLLFYPIAAVIGGFACALAFMKVNQQPFPVLLKRAFLFSIRPKLYLWKKEEGKRVAAPSDITKKEATITEIPRMSASKLSDLAWSLDIQGRSREGNDSPQPNNPTV